MYNCRGITIAVAVKQFRVQRQCKKFLRDRERYHNGCSPLLAEVFQSRSIGGESAKWTVDFARRALLLTFKSHRARKQRARRGASFYRVRALQGPANPRNFTTSLEQTRGASAPRRNNRIIPDAVYDGVAFTPFTVAVRSLTHDPYLHPNFRRLRSQQSPSLLPLSRPKCPLLPSPPPPPPGVIQ